MSLQRASRRIVPALPGLLLIVCASCSRAPSPTATTAVPRAQTPLSPAAHPAARAQSPTSPLGRAQTPVSPKGNASRGQSPGTPKGAPERSARAAESNLQKFRDVQEGMTYDEVLALVGSPGLTVSKTDNGTLISKWTAGASSNFLAKFQDGKLTRKTVLYSRQDGAEAARPSEPLTEEKYAKVQEGMSLDDVLTLLDIQPKTMSDAKSGVSLYRWTDATGASFIGKFQDGNLVRKTGYTEAPQAAEPAPAHRVITKADLPAPQPVEETAAVEDTAAAAAAAAAPETATSEEAPAPPAAQQPAAAPEPDRRIRVAGANRRARQAEEGDDPNAGHAYKPKASLPGYTWNLHTGVYEVRIKNNSDSTATAGLRTGKYGRDVTVKPNGEASIFVDQGNYDLYFKYDNDPHQVYHGQGVSIDGFQLSDLEVTLADKNYDVRFLNRGNEPATPRQ